MNKAEHQVQQALKQVIRFRMVLFFAFLAAVYGYIVWRVNVLANVPAAQATTAQTIAATPQIDQATITKIEQLQDNSVSVKALFDDARQNPFKE